MRIIHFRGLSVLSIVGGSRVNVQLEAKRWVRLGDKLIPLILVGGIMLVTETSVKGSVTIQTNPSP